MKLSPDQQLLHDLRTPLGVVVAYADILASEKHGPLTPKQARAIANISTAAARITDLLTKAEQAQAS